jgi:glutamine amidotransferase
MIAIVDYQMGNLRSVQKAFEQVGCEAILTNRISDLKNAHRVVLPGVGAFPDAMTEINRRNLADPLRELIRSGKPFLGICLGLQLLFETSQEGEVSQGLGIFGGDVRKFDLNPEYKVPHMGWNEINFDQDSPLLKNVPPQSYVYFVHSYYVQPTDPGVVALSAHHGHTFCAAAARDNIFATQFHPEKSQAVGLQIIKNFANWDA